MRRMAVLVNPKALNGAGADRDRLRLSFAAKAVEASIAETSGGEIAEAVRAALLQGVDAVVAAGGDGTVSAAAGALAGSGVPLGILPLGTLNHFAADLGIPTRIDDAVEVACAEGVRQVDLGEVNGHIFVNNSAIGLYPLAVRERESTPLGKWTAMGMALAKLLWHFPSWRLRIAAEDRSVPRRTPMVFIGNNIYEMNLLTPKKRPRLDEGVLFACLTPGVTRRGLFLIGLRAVFGGLDAARDLETLSAAALRIDAPGPLDVANDGEVMRLSPPFFYRIRPGALRVLAKGGA